MLIFLHGSDTFRAKEKLEELKRRFLEKNNGNSFLISKMDGAEFNIAEFRNKVLSSGFFAEKKMVILQGEIPSNPPLQKGGRGGFSDEVLEIIKKIPEEVVLVIWCKEMDDKFLKSDLGKFLLGQKYVFEFNPLSGNAIVSWIRERAKNYGCEIDNEAIAEICDILGSDLWKIDLELSKLCAYAQSLHSPSPRHPALDAGSHERGDSRLRGNDSRESGDDKKKISVTKKIVSEMIVKEAEDNIFKFIDALAAKNKRLAFLTLEEEFRAGAADLQILGAVVRQVRILLQIKSMGQGLQKDAIAKQLAIHPYVAQKSLQQVKNFQLNELKNIYRQLLAIDMGIKTGGASPRAMFGRMIARI